MDPVPRLFSYKSLKRRCDPLCLFLFPFPAIDQGCLSCCCFVCSLLLHRAFLIKVVFLAVVPRVRFYFIAHSCIMEFTPLENIGPYSHEGTIRVRVCRVWKHKTYAEDADYSSFDGVLLDAKGDSIQFTTDIMDLGYFEPRLLPGRIYRISAFYARRNNPSGIIVDRSSMLEFRSMTINIADDDGNGPAISPHKFDLLDFSRLEPRRRKHRVLTDVIGHLKGAQPIRSVFCEGKRLENKRDIFIENIRAEERRLTLWGEHIRIYDDTAVAEADSPVIVVFTSTKVTDFKGEQCLSSSPATLMFLNPDIPELLPYKKVFAGASTSINPLPLPGPVPLTTDEILSKPTMTVHQLQLMDPEQNKEKALFCKAKVTRISMRNGWYYNSCPNCTFSLRDKNGTACSQHGIPTNGPIPWYKIALIVADEKENATFMLMGMTAQTFLDAPASKYATDDKEADDIELPQEIAKKLLHKTFLFQLRFGSPKNTNARSDFLVSNMVHIDTSSGQPEESSSLTIKASSSQTSTNSEYLFDLHTPELPYKRSKPNAETPPLLLQAPHTKKKLLLTSNDQLPVTNMLDPSQHEQYED